MIVLVAFSVPLYDLFCRVTGYGGKTNTSEILSSTILERDIDLKFSALFYNTYRLTASIVSIKNIENYNNINKKLKYFLKKNKINIDLNIKLNDRKYNLFFEEDDSFKLDFK